MFSARNRFLTFPVAAILVALTLPHPASARCGLLRQDFLNISLEIGNAFVADYSTNTRSPILRANASPINTGLKSVARDSEGRVRVVRSAGKYIVKETDGVSTEAERLLATSGAFRTFRLQRDMVFRCPRRGHAADA